MKDPRNIADVTNKMLAVKGIPISLKQRIEKVMDLMAYKAPEQQGAAWEFVDNCLSNEYGESGPQDEVGKKICAIFTTRDF